MKKTTQHQNPNQLTKGEKIEALLLFGSGALFILAQVIRLIFNF